MSFPTKSRPARVALVQAARSSTPAPGELAGFFTTNPSIVWLGAVSIDAESIRSLSDSAPDVAVVDLRAATVFDTDQLLRQIHAASQSTQIVALCDAGDETGARRALGAGAAACLSRQNDPLSVLRAINDVMRGRMHLSPTGERAIRGLLDPTTVDPKSR